MTKKDYVGLAEAIAPFIPPTSLELQRNATVENLAHSIANYCERENPRGFDREMFLINCGINEPTKEKK